MASSPCASEDIWKYQGIHESASRVPVQMENMTGWWLTHPRTTIQVCLGRLAHRCKQLRGAVKPEVVEHERGRHCQDRSNYCESFQQLMALDGCWWMWENTKGGPDRQRALKSWDTGPSSCHRMSGWEGTLVMGRYAAHFPIGKGHHLPQRAAQ